LHPKILPNVVVRLKRPCSIVTKAAIGHRHLHSVIGPVPPSVASNWQATNSLSLTFTSASPTATQAAVSPDSHITPLQVPWRTQKIDTRISPCRTTYCACAVAKELASLCREQRAEKSRTGRSGLQLWPPRGTRRMRMFPACNGGSPNGNAQPRGVGR